jgi:hypothetical protein
MRKGKWVVVPSPEADAFTLDQVAELLRARIGNDGTAEADTLADIADIVRASGRDLGGVA